jgi:hypothetical protein
VCGNLLLNGLVPRADASDSWQFLNASFFRDTHAASSAHAQTCVCNNDDKIHPNRCVCNWYLELTLPMFRNATLKRVPLAHAKTCVCIHDKTLKRCVGVCV